MDEIWDKELLQKDHNNLNSFFWLFSLDLKSSKRETQNIILKWIEKNITDVYAQAMVDISNTRVKMADEYNKIKKIVFKLLIIIFITKKIP